MVLRDFVVVDQTEVMYEEFHATDGALVDLKGLEAIADGPARFVNAALCRTTPTRNNMVLSGLELKGNHTLWRVQMPHGEGEGEPPVVGLQCRGIVQPPKDFVIGVGSGLVCDENGRALIVPVKQPIKPKNKPSATNNALVLELKTISTKKALAHHNISPLCRFVPQDEAFQFNRLPLAININGNEWATDIVRVLAPESTQIKDMLQVLAYLEHIVWDSERHGWPAERRQMGREWSRYQTSATLALQATRACLTAQTTTSFDRVRLLRNLAYQLWRTVENAEGTLSKWMRLSAGIDPYRTIPLIGMRIAGPNGRPPAPLMQKIRELFGDFNMRVLSKKPTDPVSVFVHPPLTVQDGRTLGSFLAVLHEFQIKQSASNPDMPHPSTITFAVGDSDPIALPEMFTASQQSHLTTLSSMALSCFTKVSGWTPI